MRDGILGRNAMGRLAKPARQPEEKKQSWRVGEGKLKDPRRTGSSDKVMFVVVYFRDAIKSYADKGQKQMVLKYSKRANEVTRLQSNS